jgi:hypothetical protein
MPKILNMKIIFVIENSPKIQNMKENWISNFVHIWASGTHTSYIEHWDLETFYQ